MSRLSRDSVTRAPLSACVPVLSSALTLLFSVTFSTPPVVQVLLAQIGALSVVLKGSKLEGSAIYAGIPARKIERKSNAKAVDEDDAATGFF